MEGKLRTLIVDDERSSRRAIEIQLEDMEDVEIVGQAADGAEAVQMIRTARPDLVFLDVQMPDLDGFQILEELGPDPLPRIVFVTAHDAFAVRAFDVSATDYLLKPVDDRQLRRAIDRVRRDLQAGAERGTGSNVRRLMDHIDQEGRSSATPHKKRLLAKEKGEYFFIHVADMEWIEAEGNYVRVHLDGGAHLIRASMNELEITLDPEQFLRVHRGAIINLDRVESIQPEGVSDYRVILRSGQAVKVGRTYRDSLLQRRG
jgi:two-component system, LytTR family, response regulator